MLGHLCQQVVACVIHRTEQIPHYAAIRAVRCQQGHERAYARNHGDYEQAEHRVAPPILCRRIREAVFLLFAATAQPRYAVLHHAQRAYHRAIDAPQHQGQRHKKRHHARIQGEQCRQKLNSGHPSEPCMEESRQIQEQHGDAHYENGRKYDSNTSQHSDFG